MAFSDDEKAKIIRYLGYANWRSLAQSYHLGYPALSQPYFLVLDAFNRIDENSEALIRRDVCELEAIENQRSDARSRFKAKKIGNLEVNPQEIKMLEAEENKWVARLADDLGVYRNQYASTGTSSARNAKVYNG
jgi:hypothetical protein